MRLPRRKNVRIKEYDYTLGNWYYVTICTHNKKCILGKIINGKMYLNEYGKIVKECLLESQTHFQNVEIEYYVIMPNHIHCIIIIDSKSELKISNEDVSPGAADTGWETQPLQTKQKILKPSLGQIVVYIKYQSSRKINIMHNTKGEKLWQRNYFEHIIRNEMDLYNVRNYIKFNPLKWDIEKNYPDN